MPRQAGRQYTDQRIFLMTTPFRKKLSYMAASDGLNESQLLRKAVADYEKNFDAQRNDDNYLNGACNRDISGNGGRPAAAS